MIGPRAYSMLRRRAGAWTLGSLAGSLALWGLLVLAASNLLSAASLLGLIGRDGHDGLLILVISTFPLALFRPPDPRSGLVELRALDRDAVLESALAASPGDAAEPLLRRTGEGAAESAGRIRPKRRPTSRGRLCWILAAGGVILVSQGTFLFVTGRPVIGYASLNEPRGRAEEGAEAFARPEAPDPAEGDGLPVPEAAGDRDPETRRENPAERARREAEFADLHGLLRQDREGLAPEPREGDPAGEGTAPPPPSPAGGDGAPGGDSGSPGRSGGPGPDAPAPEGSGGGGEPRGSGGGERNQGPGSGWSDSPGAPGRNAMKDYRSAFEKILTERTGAAVTAGQELSLAETEAAVLLYFDSLRLRVEVDPEEDPLTAGLRAAWLRLREGLR